MIRRMLVADDGSPSGEHAFVAALDLARRLWVSLDMICVEELPRFPATIDEVEETRAELGGGFAKVVEAAKTRRRRPACHSPPMSSPGTRCRASPNSSSGAATICWS